MADSKAMTLQRSAKPKPPKPKPCKECRKPFRPSNTLHVLCGAIACAIAYGEKSHEKSLRIAAKAERADTRARKERIKTRSDWMKEAQIAFNAFVRERDRIAGYPCISSGRPLEWGLVGGGVDAGHYRSVGSAPHLRFDLRNVHAQSKQDNRYGAGAAVDYRIGLIARIGLGAVEELEADQTSRKWSIDDLRNIKQFYRAALAELKKT